MVDAAQGRHCGQLALHLASRLQHSNAPPTEFRVKESHFQTGMDLLPTIWRPLLSISTSILENDQHIRAQVPPSRVQGPIPAKYPLRCINGYQIIGATLAKDRVRFFEPIVQSSPAQPQGQP